MRVRSLKGWTSAGAAQGWWELLLVLIGGVLLAWFASATPRPLDAAAPAARFSAGRAMVDIGQLARTPHPVGSGADASVRDAIVKRLRIVGLSPQVSTFDHVRAWDRPSDPQTYRVADILARVAGRKPGLPAILVMSHYDSVVRSPGAADDMAGVASALEMARLLKLQPPERDVMFAFTDGEEAGLVGAGALLADPGFVRGIGTVVNMDVRGGGGRALMFQTGRDAGGLERLYADHPLGPAGNSLAAYLYSILPNDTDFSVALAHGLSGLNYAFIGRPALYHTPAATPQAVEAGAVQSLGEQAWVVVQSLAALDSLPAPHPDLTWFDLLGRRVVIYPPAFGWVSLLGCAMLAVLTVLMLRIASPIQVSNVLGGVAQALAATLMGAAVLYAYGRLYLHGYYAALAQAKWTEGLIAAACLGAAVLAFRAPRPALHPVGRWLGVILLSWFIAVVLQVVAPRTAFVAEWPTLMATVAWAAIATGAPGGRGVALILGVLSLGFLLEIEHMLVLGVGLLTPAAGAAILPLAAPVVAPFLQAPSDR